MQQFQKRKHLTSGKINGNGWRPRTAAANAIINSSDNYTTLALKDYSIRKIHEQVCEKMKYKKEKKDVRICSKASEKYLTQIFSSRARIQLDERRRVKRLDQVIWSCLSYCTERKAVYKFFEPFKISWKIRKPSCLSRFYFCYRRLLFLRVC